MREKKDDAKGGDPDAVAIGSGNGELRRTPVPPSDEDRPQSHPGAPFPGRLILAGCAVLAGFFGLFSVWAAVAPIESAVLAPGVISVDGYRKSIQHLEGGIIQEILVEDGDAVRAGQTLIVMRDLQPAAEYRQLTSERHEARAIVARLTAERDGAETIAFPQELLADPDPAAASAVAGQQSVFASRRESFAERLSVLGQQIRQFEEEIIGLEGQIDALERQRALVDEELSEVSGLFRKGLTPKPRLLALQRRQAEIDGDISAFRANIARARQKILTTKLQMGELRAARNAEVVEHLRAERARVYQLSERIIAAGDVLRRTKVLSPIDGVVVDLQVHTKDGVVNAGQRLLDVVPSQNELVVEASIDPIDIDEVAVGMPAHVQLTSLRRRVRRPLEGRVTFVSADRLIDAQSGVPFYQARVVLDRKEGEEFGEPLQAGMGAEVYIRTAARTPLEYWLDPLLQIIDRSMRESL